MDFAAIVFHSPIATIVSVGMEEKVVLINQKFTEQFGYTLEDAYDFQRWWTQTYPDWNYRNKVREEWIRRVIKATQNHKKIESMETTLTCKDGSSRYVRFSFASAGSKNIITCEDLTELKRMEIALRASEIRYRSIFDAVADIIFTVEMDGSLSSISPAFARMTGWFPDEWIGRHFSPLVYLDDQEYVQKLFERLLSGDTVPAFQMRLMTKAGNYVEAEVKSVAIHNTDGVTIFGVLRDITERKRAEELVYRRLIYENMLSRISSMALAAGSLQDFLEQCIATMGETAVVSRSYFFEHHHETDTMDNTHEWCAPGIIPHKNDLQNLPSHIAPRLMETLRSGKTICFAHVEDVPDESVKKILRNQGVCSILMVPLFVDGRYYGHIGFDDCLQHRVWPQEDVDVLLSIARIIAIVIEQKQAEERIHQLNEALETKVRERTNQLLIMQDNLIRKEKLSLLGQVAGSVGHELRNPLGVMSNAVYFLQTVLSDADKIIIEYLDIINKEIGVADRIVGDLLDSVRVKSPYPEWIPVTQLIEQSLKKCTIPASVTLRLDIQDSLPLLRVDPMQINQVLRNLINNGVEAMQEGGELVVRAIQTEQADFVLVSIKDNGVGMNSEQMEKLFQPLFTTKARGIGLGLIVVKNLIQVNGGNVEAESELGVGSTFTVSLPTSSGDKNLVGNLP